MDAWIDTIPPSEGHGTLGCALQADGEGWRSGPCHSGALPSTQGPPSPCFVFYKGVMHGDNDLPYVEREIIAVTVSLLNHCHY